MAVNYFGKDNALMSGRKEEYWSRFAQSFEDDQEYVAGKSSIQTLVKRLKGERDLQEVIEFGCGTGKFTKAIAKNAEHIIATDLSDEMLEMATIRLRRFKNVTVRKADCYHTSFPSGRFDTVFMANLIHVIEYPHDTLRESHRISRNGGTLLIASFTNYGRKESDMIRTATRYLERFGMPPPYFRDKLSPDELAHLVEGAGFQVREVQLLKNWLYLKGMKA